MRWPHALRTYALRLAGHWLQQIGFTEGAKVNVTAENGRLVLAVAE